MARKVSLSQVRSARVVSANFLWSAVGPEALGHAVVPGSDLVPVHCALGLVAMRSEEWLRFCERADAEVARRDGVGIGSEVMA